MHKLICLFLILASSSLAKANKLIDIKKISPSIIIQMKYFTTDNFVGDIINGYEANKCLLLKEAANSLKKAQSLAIKKGLSLMVHDCYRPQRGVNHFIRWSKNPNDRKTKKKYYPNIKKQRLFELGYIAKRSGHSRGSTVDLTLVDLKSQKALEMGTIYDFLDPLSNTENPQVTKEHLKNRKTLVNIMDKAGFKNYSKEWWHYSLKEEPNKDQFFDFVIK